MYAVVRPLAVIMCNAKSSMNLSMPLHCVDFRVPLYSWCAQQNLGAIIRSAYCLGATGILASAKNCAPLSAVVSKASAGVLETVPLHSCKNMQRTLTDAAERGWAVLGASAGRGALPLGQVAVDRPTVLVLGQCAMSPA